MVIIINNKEWRLTPINLNPATTACTSIPSSILSSADSVQRTFQLGITPTDFYAMAIRKL